MRFSPLLVVTLVALAGCSKENEGIRLLPEDRSVTVPPPIRATSSHRCGVAAVNGSAEQVACFNAAKAACPAGTAPIQIEFEEREDGQFVIKGYGCA